MQEKKEKSPDLSDFSFEEGSGGLVAVFLVVGLTFNHPVPRFQRLLATRQILLRHERSLVLGDAHQVRFTGLDRSGNCREASANCELLAGRLRGTFVAVRLKRVHALTIGVGRRSYAVRRYQIVSVTVVK